MRSTRTVVMRWIVIVLILGFFLPQLPAQAQDSNTSVYIPLVAVAGQQSESTVAIQASDADVAATDANWTPERMAGAKAYETGAAPLFRPSAAEVATAAAADALLAPGYAAGGRPDPAANRMAMQEFPDAWAAINEELDASLAPDGPDGTAGVFTTYTGNFYTSFYTQYPYSTIGKLLFTSWNGASSYCSASLISPNNIIVTAAHCLYDTGVNRWHSNWRFIPAQRNGVGPWGQFNWRSARVPTAYVTAPSWNSAIRYDVGLIKLWPNANGRDADYYAGYLGRTWDNSYTRSITEIGYPSNYSTLYTRIGHAETRYYTADVLGYGSDMGQGASGSPLIMTFRPYGSGAMNYASAVQSGSNIIPTPTDNVAPRFTTGNFLALCNAEGC